ncbi:YlxR family protein [Jannaschia sp. R86511]|uniref:YlxR family protein n=1 Tax=Jannaschia sp. R86511 TaxID=3093853 RepID=UPI0036D3EF5B
MTPSRSVPARDGATLDTASNGVTVSRPTRSQSADPVPAGPVRTCIGCRRTAPRSVLVRIVGVEVEGRLLAVPDPAAVRPGRGAWVHRDRGCVELAERRRAFARALRLAGPVDPAAVREHVAAAEEHRTDGSTDHGTTRHGTTRQGTTPNRKRVDEV